MKRFPLKKIDAFAKGASSGNPAGVIYLGPHQGVSDREILRIAQELKGFVSEVGFVRIQAGGEYAIRYYSAEREVEFCGHATIAIVYDLLKNGSGSSGGTTATIVTPKGALQVENRIEEEDAVFIAAPTPVYSQDRIALTAVAEALDLAEADIHARRPIAVVNAGLETLILPMASLEAVLAMNPSLEKSKSFCRENGIDIITVFSGEVSDPANRFRTRVFASTYGYLEDPATGSGSAALGCYLLQQGLWDGAGISLEQNGSRERPNIVKIAARNAADGARQSAFGGNAVLRIQGEYCLA
ncbi:MAG: PhzF family phenazine biosynthesis protein [Anaerolineales bacterium]|nr:PhzF family phenazine biosynthesis protein [Anaerolineales bacterium]